MANNYLEFDKAVERAVNTEEKVASLLREAGAHISKLNKDNRQDFEVLFNNHTFRVEVKDEDEYANSGNICVEMFQGKPPVPSGLLTSEATIFVHTLGEWCALYRRRDMYIWTREERNRGTIKLETYGDNNNQLLILSHTRLKLNAWFDHRLLQEISKSALWGF